MPPNGCAQRSSTRQGQSRHQATEALCPITPGAMMTRCSAAGFLGWVYRIFSVLDADNRPVGNLTTQERIEPVDNCDMAWTDGTHRTPLAINQFDTVIFCQNARLYHASEVGDSKLP